MFIVLSSSLITFYIESKVMFSIILLHNIDTAMKLIIVILVTTMLITDEIYYYFSVPHYSPNVSYNISSF